MALEFGEYIPQLKRQWSIPDSIDSDMILVIMLDHKGCAPWMDLDTFRDAHKPLIALTYKPSGEIEE